MFGHIYEGRRVFVTGHTGFKGSWLTAWLLQMGAEVAGFSDAVPTAPSVRCTFPVRSRTIIDRGYPLSAVKRRLFRLAHAAAAAALVRAGQAAWPSGLGRTSPQPCKTPNLIVHNFPSFCKMKIAKDPFFSQKLQIGRRSSCRYVKFGRYFLSRSSDPIVF